MNQIKKMNVLDALRIVDTPPEQAYDDIVLLASKVLNCSAAVVSFFDGDRIWFKASIGSSVNEVPRVGSFCELAIQEDQIFVVSNASQDVRFKHNQLVKSGFNFYAGAPLILKNGNAVGTLSVLDSKQRSLTSTETELLQVLARQVVGELEQRLSLFELAESNRAVEAAETKYRNLVQLSPAGIFQTDAQGKFVFVSEHWQKVAGLTMAEAIDAGWENAVHPDDKEKIFKEWMAADSERRPFKCEYRLRTPDGIITWVNAESRQLRDENDAIVGYLGALQDISNLKSYEDELLNAQGNLEARVEERTADLRSLTESIPQLVWKISPSGESLYMSPNWTELTGVSIDKAQWEDIIHPEDVPTSKIAWMNCLETGSSYETEYRIKLKDGNYRWYLARGVPQLGINGKIKLWFGTCTDIDVQKKAIEKAHFAEQKLSQFLASIPTILWATDINGIVTLSEGKGLVNLGLKPGEAVGWDLLNRPEGAASATQLKRALSGESFSDVTNFGDRIIETQYSPLLDLGGTQSGMVAITKDITEESSLEKSLFESRQTAADLARRLQAVLQNAPIALNEINADWNYTFSDGRYLSNLGLKPGELIGKSCLDRHKSSPERMKALQRSFDGETVSSEFQMGDQWVLNMTTPFLEKDGIVQSILTLTIDITNQKRAEKTVQTSESKFRKVCESKMFGMIFWDQKGNINETNDAFLTMLGYTRDDLTAGLLNWKNLTPPEYAELDARAVEETLARGYCEPYEKVYIRKDGSHIAIIISGATIQGEENTGGIALVIDVSAKKKAEMEKAESILKERAALHASKTKSQFLANMSHEIRTPINGVIGMLGLLMDTPLQAEQRDFAESARTSADALLNVINDILDFSKIEAGKLDFENIDFDFHSLLQDVERAFVYQTHRKNLRLVFNRDQNVSRFLNGDSGRLRQVLNNLLSNAVKFTSKGQITVNINQNPVTYQLRIEIRDTGAGIPAHALDRMFKAFSQADSSTARRFGGTGLGLSICKNLVELMHGKIGVETKENEGSVFWFTIQLPAAKHPVLEVKESIGTFSDGFSRPFRVLIAEDNAVNQMIALRYLEKMGLRADAVANGIEVLDSLRSIPYDLILMDCQMPEMDGYEATKLIRASATLEQRNIPIIAMTANAIKGDREQCLASGMNDYVSKPVAPEVLFQMLKKWLIHSPPLEGTLPEANVLTNSQTLDLSAIDSIQQLATSGKDGLLADLIALYLASVPPAIAKMKKSFAEQNFKLVGGEAHQLKSSSANLGAKNMALISSQIEQAADANDRVHIEVLLNKIDDVFQEGKTALQNELSRRDRKSA